MIAKDKQYRCQFFPKIQELVPPAVYRDRGEEAWQLLDSRLLVTLDNLRFKYGSIIVNDYLWNGKRSQSGLRTPESGYYSPYSQHTFGRAADCLFRETSVDRVREDILTDPDRPEFKYINAVELEVSWLHIDVRNVDRILAFRP